MKQTLTRQHIEMLARCGQQYQFRYIEGRKIPPTSSEHASRAIRGAVEGIWQAKAKTGELPTAEAAKEASTDLLNESWDAEGVYFSEMVDNKALASVEEVAIRGNVVDLCARTVEEYLDYIAPKIKVDAVHRPWRVELAGFPFDLEGIIHAQTGNSVRRLLTRRYLGDAEIDRDLETTMGAFARFVFDKLETRTQYVDSTKLRKSIVTFRTAEDRGALVQRVEATATCIDREVFLPAPPTSFYCSKDRCGYWQDVCPYGRRARTKPKD